MIQRVINLLPQPLQDTARYRLYWLSFKRLFAITLLCLGIVLFLELGLRIYIEREKVVSSRKIEDLEKIVSEQDNEGVKKQVRELNSYISDYNKLKDDTPHWSGLLRLVASLAPTDIKLQSVSANASSKSLEVTGYSPTRESVLQFYENVRLDKKNFVSIDFPLENIARSTQVNFRFTITLAPEVLQGGGL